MRFVDTVCFLRLSDDAEFEQKHDRDKDGKFSSSGRGQRLLSGKKSQLQLKAEHKERSIKEFYGEEVKGRGLKGRTAVHRLIEEQRGHIKAAFHRDDIGDIDLVWGDTQAGLCHVFYRRTRKKEDVQRVVNNIANTIANGEIERGAENNRNFALRYGSVRVLISKGFKEDGSLRLMVSAYEVKKRASDT